MTHHTPAVHGWRLFPCWVGITDGDLVFSVEMWLDIVTSTEDRSLRGDLLPAAADALEELAWRAGR